MHAVLLLLIALGLLLPRTGAALAEGLGFETVVICTGDALVRVTLHTDGVPIETDIEDHEPCRAADLPSVLAAPVPAWHRMAATHARLLPDPPVLPASAPWHGPPPERGPPVRV